MPRKLAVLRENMRWTPEKQEKKRRSFYATRAAWIKAGRPRTRNRLHLPKDFPASYKDAKRQGLKFYYTGKPCKNGHLTVRKVNSRHCYECMRQLRHVMNARTIKMPPVLEPVPIVQDMPYRTIVL